MIENQVEVFDRAENLPDAWEEAAPHPFLRRETLCVLEKANPCGQKYYFLGDNGRQFSLAVTYRHRLNLLACVRGFLPVPATVIGVPCSVAKPGFHLSPASGRKMLDHLSGLAGLKLILNSSASTLPGFTTGQTLPDWRLHLDWMSFDQYMNSMRSHYRRRIRQALNRCLEVQVKSLTPDEFDEKWYALYLQVYRRSAYKLEKLTPDFFQRMAADIDVFENAGGIPLGFTQTKRNGGELIFMFGGINYNLQADYDLYWNMMMHVVAKGIRSECSSIDLGQTGDIAKSRIGATSELRNFHAAHSSKLINALVQRTAERLSYKCTGQTTEAPRVFKPNFQ